jgi:hypothetical protein
VGQDVGDRLRRDIQRGQQIESLELAPRRVLLLVGFKKLFDNQVSVAGPGIVKLVGLVLQYRVWRYLYFRRR